MKKFLAMSLAFLMALSFVACDKTAVVEPEVETPQVESPGESEVVTTYVKRDDWDSFVKTAVNDFMDMYGHASKNYDENSYVVFDFDNTCSIFDIEEQLAVFQLQKMAFAFTPEDAAEILLTELGDANMLRGTDYSEVDSSYNDWISDITLAYSYLYETYGPFNAAGLDDEAAIKVQSDPQWAEFATKMRAMYDLVYDSESASVAYPWVLYWFTGMTEPEVYDLALASHNYYGAVETSEVTWSTALEGSKTGAVEYTWTSGTGVSENIKELWAALQANGIDVWVCSASDIDPIRAAIDAFGLHEYCTGAIAMSRVVEDGKYINAYDYEAGYPWFAKADGVWEEGTKNAMKAQTQGVGKVEAIRNSIWPEYGLGPIAGFMDSTGDYNFCTEFSNLKFVININRASRKVTDGGGVIAALAVYQRDTLGYKLASANEAGDTLFVLQGREENGFRGLRASDKTMRFGAEEEILFKGEENEAQLQYIIKNKMATEDVINTFAMKTAADDEGNELGFKYGFLTDYAGYHNIK